jgi:predicted DNA-binding protein YlxM (UPF0122 family)
VLESVSFAFLLALEALTPKQRAVLLLRDVFDYTVGEVVEALGMSEAGVNTTLRRARRAMSSYDAARSVPTRAAQERNRGTLEALLRALVAKDVPAIERLLARDVRYLSDGGGEFAAAGAPIVGASRLAALLRRLLEIRGPPDETEVRMVNGFPAVLARYRTVPGPRAAPAFLMRLDVDAEGRVRELHSVLASRKLAAVGLATPDEQQPVA